MRAIIDIGTNSVRLLLAEKDDKDEWKVLKKDLRSSRLGEGMTDTACIGQGARERTLQAVEGFVKEAKEAGADEIFAYGTSIMRDAGNGPDFAKLVEETTGVKVRILSGTEEAYYSYIGAAGTPGVLTADPRRSAWDSARTSACATASSSDACAAPSSSTRRRQEASAC